MNGLALVATATASLVCAAVAVANWLGGWRVYAGINAGLAVANVCCFVTLMRRHLS